VTLGTMGDVGGVELCTQPSLQDGGRSMGDFFPPSVPPTSTGGLCSVCMDVAGPPFSRSIRDTAGGVAVCAALASATQSVAIPIPLWRRCSDPHVVDLFDWRRKPVACRQHVIGVDHNGRLLDRIRIPLTRLRGLNSWRGSVDIRLVGLLEVTAAAPLRCGPTRTDRWDPTCASRQATKFSVSSPAMLRPLMRDRQSQRPQQNWCIATDDPATSGQGAQQGEFRRRNRYGVAWCRSGARAFWSLVGHLGQREAPIDPGPLSAGRWCVGGLGRWPPDTASSPMPIRLTVMEFGCSVEFTRV
jgi:hypothetical protein